VARPKKEIDPEKVETLAGMGLSAELIAAVLGCDHHTIERRFAPILKKGRQKRDGRLMVKLYQEALGTPCNTAIAIFLAKNWLGMADRPDFVVNVQQNAQPFFEVTDSVKAKIIKMTNDIRAEAERERNQAVQDPNRN
jgi:hypothetical protein